MVLRFFLLAVIFLFISCGDIERDNPEDQHSNNYRGMVASLSSSSVAKSSSSSMLFSSSSRTGSSSSILPSSSSLVQSSSSKVVYSSSSTPSSSSVVSSSACTAANNTSTQYCSNGTMKDYGFVTYEGQTYKTVVIGTQTWMAENLNHNVSSSKCGDGSSLSDANTTTCNTYGRLYNWATAMALPSKCYSTLSTSDADCAIKTPHKGICPSGWHIPSDADWNVLMKIANPSCSDNSSCAVAGKRLKATSGWNENSNGTDDFGFAALPGGHGTSGGYFDDVGNQGRWWSASENNASYAYYRYINYEYVIWIDNYKGSLHSVRCLKD